MSNNGIVNIHGKDYMTVAKRVELFLAENKECSIETEILTTSDNHVVVKATVSAKGRVTTGISSVDLASSKMIEKSNPYEVAETSAVGRALGFAGYGIVEGIASADEMAKATAVGQRVDYGNPIDNKLKPFAYNEESFEAAEDAKVCSAHDEPVAMFQGKSKSKTNADGTPKTYWWHKGPNGQMCFGSGYQD